MPVMINLLISDDDAILLREIAMAQSKGSIETAKSVFSLGLLAARSALSSPSAPPPATKPADAPIPGDSQSPP